MILEYQRLPSGQLCIHGKGANLYLHINHTFRCTSILWKWAFSSCESRGMSSAQSNSVISICFRETLGLTGPWLRLQLRIEYTSLSPPVEGGSLSCPEERIWPKLASSYS